MPSLLPAMTLDLKLFLRNFFKKTFVSLARKPLKQYKTLSSAVRNSCVCLRAQKVFVSDSRALAMSNLFTWVFLLGLIFDISVFPA